MPKANDKTRPSQKKQADTSISLEEAERQVWLLGLASPIEILEYPAETTQRLKKAGISHIWQCYEQMHVFIDSKQNTGLWRRIVALGLPRRRDILGKRRSLAPDLIEKLKRDDLFDAPAAEPIAPPSSADQPQTTVEPNKPFAVPTQAELEALLQELDSHADRVKQRMDKLCVTIESLEGSKASLEMIEASAEMLEKMESFIKECEAEVKKIEAEAARIEKLIIAISEVKPLVSEFELVLTALNR